MDLTTTMFLIAGVVMVIVLLIGWEVSGRWAYLTSRSARRLQEAEMLEAQDELDIDPSNPQPAFSRRSLARRLNEADIHLSSIQFILASILLAVSGVLLSWVLFIPGLPAIAVGAILGYLPFAYLQERARNRGRLIDEKLAIALSRIAPGLHTNRGLDQILEEVALSLQTEGPNPLSRELLKTVKDLRTKDAEGALQDLARRSPSLSLANVAMLLESYLRAGGGHYAEVISDTAASIQRIIAVRTHAQAKATQPLQSARFIPAILGFVLIVMLNDPLTRASFREPLVQVATAMAMGVMLLGYVYIRNEVLKAV